MGVSRDEAMNQPNAESQTSHSSAVRVAVRVRPLLHFEKAQKQGECTRVLPPPNELQIAVGPIGDGWSGCGGRGEGKSFTFDATFSTRASQSSLYEECITPLVEAFFEGFNSTIIAYGQTGSGKTYTMGSASSARLPEEEQGVIPRVISSLFDIIDGAKHSSSTMKGVAYSVRCQFLEIYGEDVRDLLDPTGLGSIVSIREGQNGEVNVHGAVEELVHDAEAMLMVLERGSLCRKTGSTLMNSSSSRSHAIFTVFLEQRIAARVDGADGGNGDEDVEVRCSKFHFVDLAGSERAKRTRAEGQRFKEGVDINKGLLTLGNVISALGDETKCGKVHVPYRDSKLTRMLQDSLGGNSRTLMIACVSPAEANMHETINALRYANRARNIQNKPVVNRDHNSSIICDLKAKVQMLATEVLRLQQLLQQRQHSSEEKTSEEEKDAIVGGLQMPFEALQELANATPSKNVVPPRLSKRLLPGCSTSPIEEWAELTSMSARALEAESQVLHLVEELKLARTEAGKLSDTVVNLRSERDVLAMGGVEAWKDLAREASSSTAGEEEDSNGRPNVSAKKNRRRSKLFRFFPLKNDNSSSLTAANEQLHAGASFGSSRHGSEVDSADDDDAKKAAVNVLKEFHERIENLKNKLDYSERQRKTLEHQLVSSSALLGCESTTSRIARGGGGSHTFSQSTTTIFDRTEEQLQKERKRHDYLSSQLQSGKNVILPAKDAAAAAAIDEEMKQQQHSSSVKEEGSSDKEEENCCNSTEGEEESLDEDDSSIVSAATGRAEEMELCAKHQAKKITMELGELEKGILMKEELLVALRNNKIKFDAMEHHYKQKLGEMDVEVRRLEADHEKLLDEVKAIDMKKSDHNNNMVGTNHTAEKLRDVLKKKTAELENTKKRQQELTRLAAGRQKEAARVKGLGEEIMKMKRARVVLQKNLDNQRREQAALIQIKAREIANLKKGAKKNAGEIAKLVEAQHRAEATGRRHLEELTLLRRTLRQKHRRGKGSTAWLKKQELEMKQWVEDKMVEATNKEEQAAQLTAEYEKKLILLQQKENLELARTSITTRSHGPWSPPISPHGSAAAESKEGRATTTGKIVSGSSYISGNNTSPSEQQQLPCLSLEEQETLQEVEERLESIIAELAYKDEKIKSMERRKSGYKGGGSEQNGSGGDNASRGGGPIIFQELVSRVNDVPSSHSVIRVLIEGLMDAKRSQMKAASEACNLQDRVRSAEDALEETREMAAAESRNFDTTLVQVSTDFEKKIAGLLAHATEASTSAVSSSDTSAGGIDGAGGGDCRVVTTQQEATGPANDRTLLGLSSERNNTLRGMIRTLEARIADAVQRCKEVEGGRKEERSRRLEKEQEADWLSFELKSLKKRHVELQDQWEELKLSHSDLLQMKKEGGAVEGTDDCIDMYMEEDGGRLMTSYAAEGEELFDFGSLDDDIAAIAQGKIPESMAMVLEMSQDAVGDSHEEQKRHRSVFERLATTTTTSRALKVQDKDHVHENYKRKHGPVKTKKEHPYVEGQTPATFGIADQGSSSTGEMGGGGLDVTSASASRGQQSILPALSSPSDLPKQQHLSDNNILIPSSSILRDKEAAAAPVLLLPPPPPPTSTTTSTPSSMNIFDRLNDQTSFPVARIQKQRGNNARPPLLGRSATSIASINGCGGDPPSRNRLAVPNNNYSRSSQYPLTHQSNEQQLLPQQQQEGQQLPRKRSSVFDRLRTNITKSEALRQAELAAKSSSSCVVSNPNPTSNGNTPSNNWEVSSSEPQKC